MTHFWGSGPGPGALVDSVMTSSIKMDSSRFTCHFEYPRKNFRFSDELGKVGDFFQGLLGAWGHLGVVSQFSYCFQALYGLVKVYVSLRISSEIILVFG